MGLAAKKARERAGLPITLRIKWYAFQLRGFSRERPLEGYPFLFNVSDIALSNLLSFMFIFPQ